MDAFAVELTPEGRAAVGIHDGYGTYYVDADDAQVTANGALLFTRNSNNPERLDPTVVIIAPGLWLSVIRVDDSKQ